MTTRRLLTIAASFALAAFASKVDAQSIPSYDLETLGLANHVSEIGRSGHIVGWVGVGAFPSAKERAFVVVPGQQAALLPIPAGFDRSVANDVNASGWIVGTVAANGEALTRGLPVLWLPQPGGTYSVQFLVRPPGFTFGSALAINDVGDIVGGAHNGAALEVPSGARFSPLAAGTSFAGLGATTLVVVNDGRLAIDQSLPAKVVDMSTGTVATLPVPPPAGGSTFFGVYVNELTNNDRVCGAGRLVTLVSECAFHSAAFEPGLGWTLNGGCGPSNSALDINEGGDTVDVLGSFLHVQLDGQPSVRLDNLIVAPAGTGPWLCHTAFGASIDEQRVIACVALDIASGASHLVRLTPRVTCQTDLGFATTGNGVLSVCGGDLSAGTTAELALLGATPSTTALIGVSFTSNPTPLLGGTAVVFPPELLVPVPVDGAGVARFAPVIGGIGPFSLYVQAAWIDTSLPSQIDLSNAVRIDFLP